MNNDCVGSLSQFLFKNSCVLIQLIYIYFLLNSRSSRIHWIVWGGSPRRSCTSTLKIYIPQTAGRELHWRWKINCSSLFSWRPPHLQFVMLVYIWIQGIQISQNTKCLEFHIPVLYPTMHGEWHHSTISRTE